MAVLVARGLGKHSSKPHIWEEGMIESSCEVKKGVMKEEMMNTKEILLFLLTCS